MKKALAVIIIFLASLSIQAQERYTPEFALGLKQGINFTRIYFDPAIDQRITAGYSGGLVFTYISQQSLGIQLECNYSQQGWTEKLDSSESYFRRINSINLPFMTHVELGKGKTKLLMNLGPTMFYHISEKENIKLNDSLDARSYYGTKTDNRMEFGICLGLGMLKTSSIGIFQFECRFSQNLNNIFRNSSEFSIFSCKPQALEFSISYLIDFRKHKQIASRQVPSLLRE